MSDFVEVLIGFGSNVAPERHLPQALARLRRAVEVRAVSGVYASAPVGAPGTPPFLNAAARCRTDLPAVRLKAEVLRGIEAALGRRRSADRNAPRTIDLDLLLYGDAVVEGAASELRLPEPDLLSSPHVAVPAAEAWPEAVHPVTGETLAAIAARLEVGRPVVRLPELPGWAVDAG